MNHLLSSACLHTHTYDFALLDQSPSLVNRRSGCCRVALSRKHFIGYHLMIQFFSHPFGWESPQNALINLSHSSVSVPSSYLRRRDDSLLLLESFLPLARNSSSAQREIEVMKEGSLVFTTKENTGWRSSMDGSSWKTSAIKYYSLTMDLGLHTSSWKHLHTLFTSVFTLPILSYRISRIPLSPNAPFVPSFSGPGWLLWAVDWGKTIIVCASDVFNVVLC